MPAANSETVQQSYKIITVYNVLCNIRYCGAESNNAFFLLGLPDKKKYSFLGILAFARTSRHLITIATVRSKGKVDRMKNLIQII